ncbi:MAG: segregation/condensation protein A [Saprospiraceae bacterium]|nr:segregation/condensation protein A [Saprospiraceae bacterium]MDW8483906.1 segregation/condensation protein A [Saprospiraceae bacterium]
METFTIKLPVFEGPFDLLLFFIERDEIDIYNIPIARITREFLDYLHQMQAQNLEIASEFIVVAATLMRIKAKMLLPRRAHNEEGVEVDPRQELVDRLIEYKRYKSVLDELRHLEELRSFMAPRGFASVELSQLAQRALIDAEWERLSAFRLLRIFTRLMDRFEESQIRRRVHTIYNYQYTIQEQREYLLSRLRLKEQTSFEEVFLCLENRIHAVVTFLALLEMLNQQEVILIQGEGINNFWLLLSNAVQTA